ncbi:MAG: c-type cytochrome [Comamonadaceae bacterium]|nr:c-type cytochrome [Comamonadaceae bacterium]
MHKLLLALALLAAAPLTRAADAARGQAIYQARCSACHSVDFNGVGPAHRGVFGRLAGTAKGFTGYSPALKRSGLRWTEANLDRWLADPEALVPGQSMGISLPDAGERADVIAFLHSLAKTKE